LAADRISAEPGGSTVYKLIKTGLEINTKLIRYGRMRDAAETACPRASPPSLHGIRE
jgi:hypothetical protein